TPTTSTLSLHDALPIYDLARRVAALTLRVQRLNERQQLLVELVAADRVIDAIAALEQPRQDVVHVRDRKRVVGRELRDGALGTRSEEHTSELQSQSNLV